jgi:hypothetical protein
MRIRRWTIVAFASILAGCGGDTQAPPPAGDGKAGPAVQTGTSPKPPSIWERYQSEAGGFSILMPGKSEVSSQPGKLFTVNIVSCKQGGTDYTVTYFNPPPAAIAPAVVEGTMKRDRDMSVQDIQGTLKSEEKVTIQKGGKSWPGLASVMENATSSYTSRLYAVDGRMYSMQVVSPKGQDHTADAKKFFDSFEFAGADDPK